MNFELGLESIIKIITIIQQTKGSSTIWVELKFIEDYAIITVGGNKVLHMHRKVQLCNWLIINYCTSPFLAMENNCPAWPKEAWVNEIDLKNDKVPITLEAEFSLYRKIVNHYEYFPLLNNLSNFMSIHSFHGQISQL